MATRFWFPLTTAAEVSPAFDAAWTFTSDPDTVRRKLAIAKGVSAITAGGQIGAWTPGQIALSRQYVSAPLEEGIVFSSGVTTVAMQLMCREVGTGSNIDRSYLGVRIVSEDGVTVQTTLLVVANYFANVEFGNLASQRNATFADGDTVSASYTTVAGDRLVVEIGFTDTIGTTPAGNSKYGENATDLPVDETQVTDGAGWIEFSNTIALFSGVPNSLILLGAGAA